jgi:hypothetical protein
MVAGSGFNSFLGSAKSAETLGAVLQAVLKCDIVPKNNLVRA